MDQLTLLVALAGMTATLAAGITTPIVHTRLARASGLREQRTRAAEAYLAAVITAYSELSAFPRVHVKPPGRIRRRLEPHGGEAILYLYTRAGERLLFGNRPREVSDRLAKAYAAVVTAQPSEELVAAMNNVNDFFLEWQDADDEQRAQWPTVTHQLAAAVAAEARR